MARARKAKTAEAEVETGVRPYVVLEEIVLEDGRTVYEVVARPPARNGEHALRQAAKEVYEANDADVEPTLVAVAAKMFKPTKVIVRNQQTVSFG